MLLLVLCLLLTPEEKLGQNATDTDAGADADIGLLLSGLPSEEGTGRQWCTWWGYLHSAHHGTPIYLPSLSGLPSLRRGDRQTWRSVGTGRSQAHPPTLWHIQVYYFWDVKTDVSSTRG